MRADRIARQNDRFLITIVILPRHHRCDDKHPQFNGSRSITVIRRYRIVLGRRGQLLQELSNAMRGPSNDFQARRNDLGTAPKAVRCPKKVSACRQWRTSHSCWTRLERDETTFVRHHAGAASHQTRCSAAMNGARGENSEALPAVRAAARADRGPAVHLRTRVARQRIMHASDKAGAARF